MFWVADDEHKQGQGHCHPLPMSKTRHRIVPQLQFSLHGKVPNCNSNIPFTSERLFEVVLQRRKNAWSPQFPTKRSGSGFSSPPGAIPRVPRTGGVCEVVYQRQNREKNPSAFPTSIGGGET